MSSLSEKKIAALKPQEKRYTATDGNGLALRVYPSGRKTWVLRLSEYGKVTDITLGAWPDMPLKSARQEARRLRKNAGLTPIRGYVLNDAFRLWKGLKKGNIVSYDDEKRRLEMHVLSKIGGRQIDEITAPLVINTVRHLDASGKRATLKRVLMRLREILDLAVCAGYIQHNPIARVSRIFAAPKANPMPAIDWRELPQAMAVMSDAPRKIQVLFVFSLVTALRPGEVAKLKKDWIEESTITIPACEMKKGRMHRVPVSSFAARVLEASTEAFGKSRGQYVFPGQRSGSHISSQTLAKYLHSTVLRGRLVAHGLRSIARSWMSDHGVPYEYAEACLAHVTGSSVSRAYQRSDYLESRRPIMDQWSAYVEDCAACAGILFTNTTQENGSA